MKNGKQGTMRKLLSSPISLIIVLFAFVVLWKASSNIYEKVLISRTKLNQAQAEFSKLEFREKDLGSQVSRLSTEQGIDAEIRSKYKGVRPGEFVAVIIGDSQVASTSNASSTASVGWFGAVLQRFGF